MRSLIMSALCYHISQKIKCADDDITAVVVSGVNNITLFGRQSVISLGDSRDELIIFLCKVMKYHRKVTV